MGTTASAVFLALFALCTVITWVAIFSRGRLWRRVVALLALAALIPTAFAAVNELLGLPKPADTAWLDDLSNYRRVIAHEIREDKAIYLWLAMPDGAEPRVFSFPYETETVSRLQDAEDRSEALATDLLARTVINEARTRTALEFTNTTEFRLELPSKPYVEEEEVMVFEPATDNFDP